MVTNIKTLNGCIGLCCSQFTLFGDTKEDYIKAGKTDKDSAFVGDMLIYIGKDAERKYDDGTPWPVYTCRHWDEKTRLCTAYEQRPQLCRTFPDDGICDWEGCGYDKSKDV